MANDDVLVCGADQMISAPFDFALEGGMTDLAFDPCNRTADDSTFLCSSRRKELRNPALGVGTADDHDTKLFQQG